MRTGRRIVDGAFATGRAGDDRAADPMADPSGRRGVGVLAARFCDLCHGVGPRDAVAPTILLAPRRAAAAQARDPVTSSGATPDRARRARCTARRRCGVSATVGHVRHDRDGFGRIRVRIARDHPAPHEEDDEGEHARGRDPDRDQPAGIEPAGDRRVAPGGRDDGPSDRPQPDPEEEDRAVAAPERTDHQQHRQHRQDRQGRDALVAPATGRTGARAGASPTGPGRGSAVAQSPSLGWPWPVPVRTIVSLPTPSTNRVGAIATCSQRPIGEPSRLAT